MEYEVKFKKMVVEAEDEQEALSKAIEEVRNGNLEEESIEPY